MGDGGYGLVLGICLRCRRGFLFLLLLLLWLLLLLLLFLIVWLRLCFRSIGYEIPDIWREDGQLRMSDCGCEEKAN